MRTTTISFLFPFSKRRRCRQRCFFLYHTPTPLFSFSFDTEDMIKTKCFKNVFQSWLTRWPRAPLSAEDKRQQIESCIALLLNTGRKTNKCAAEAVHTKQRRLTTPRLQNTITTDLKSKVLAAKTEADDINWHSQQIAITSGKVDFFFFWRMTYFMLIFTLSLFHLFHFFFFSMWNGNSHSLHYGNEMIFSTLHLVRDNRHNGNGQSCASGELWPFEALANRQQCPRTYLQNL